MGDVINLVYAASHTISGLDGSAVTSIIPVHDSLIATGAAAHAAISRATQITEQMTSRASNAPMLLAWGNERLTEFRAALAQLAITKVSMIGNYTALKLDHWDKDHDPYNLFFF